MIKPDFWTSEQVVECSPITRLLFIGMWNFCDDGGNHVASLRTLKMEVFPGDDMNLDAIGDCVNELLDNDLIVEYVSEGKAYWHVTGWHHQKIEKPSYKHPEFTEDSAIDRRMVGYVSTPKRSKEKLRTTLSSKPDITPQAHEVIDYLNEKADRNFEYADSHIRLIAARIKESGLDKVKAVVDSKVSEWRGNEQFEQYLRPATLFNALKFASYAGALGSSKPAWDR